MSTFKRLLGFLRPYRRSVALSLVFAWGAMAMTIAIPWLIGRAVNAIDESNRDDILPLAIAIVGAGVIRLGLTFVRQAHRRQGLARRGVRPS